MAVTETHYEVLGTHTNADHRAIEANYRVLAQVWQQLQTESAQRQLRRIHEAWEALSDPVARLAYDRSIGVPVQNQPAQSTASQVTPSTSITENPQYQQENVLSGWGTVGGSGGWSSSATVQNCASQATESSNHRTRVQAQSVHARPTGATAIDPGSSNLPPHLRPQPLNTTPNGPAPPQPSNSQSAGYANNPSQLQLLPTSKSICPTTLSPEQQAQEEHMRKLDNTPWQRETRAILDQLPEIQDRLETLHREIFDIHFTIANPNQEYLHYSHSNFGGLVSRGHNARSAADDVQRALIEQVKEAEISTLLQKYQAHLENICARNKKLYFVLTSKKMDPSGEYFPRVERDEVKLRAWIIHFNQQNDARREGGNRLKEARDRARNPPTPARPAEPTNRDERAAYDARVDRELAHLDAVLGRAPRDNHSYSRVSEAEDDRIRAAYNAKVDRELRNLGSVVGSTPRYPPQFPRGGGNACGGGQGGRGGARINLGRPAEYEEELDRRLEDIDRIMGPNSYDRGKYTPRGRGGSGCGRGRGN